MTTCHAVPAAHGQCQESRFSSGSPFHAMYFDRYRRGKKRKTDKNRMKTIGSVNIPQKAFMAVLETEE